MIARQLKIKLALKLQRRISEYLNRLRGIRLLPPGPESPALVSLAPRLLDSQEMSQYSEELKFAFEDDRNLNIALTGAYGAGKSSIIKTWEMAHPEKTVVHVELAHFANTGKVPNLKEAVNSASSDLATTSVDVYTVQGAILNQLIHKIELPKWNKSRFRKTQHVSWWRYLITALLLVAFVALTICSLPVLEDIASTRFQRSISWQETGILALWALLTVLLLAYALGTDMMSRFLRRVKLFGNEIELFDASGDSVFDRYMDDILYLIDCANLDAVVFEDLDRFDDIMPVFEKLRELNSLLNDSSQGCGKRIKFIYLLRDNFFPSAHERVKFFDIIIPVIPYVDPKNSYATLCAYCKNIGLHVSADILFEISLFIDDPRILADIVNETYHYKNALGGETGIKGDDAHRLGLIAYKVLFPDDFANLQVGCGYLHELFLKKETLLQERKEKLEAEIANEAGCLANLVEMENESEDVRILPWALTQMASTDAFDSTNVNDLFSEFEDPEELLRTIYADDELLRRFREAKEAAIESSETLRAALNDKGDLADKRRVIEGRISALRDELQECDRLSMVDLIAEDPDAVFSIALPFMNVGWSNVERAINDVQQSQYFGLIRFLVSSGLIDESFSRYITRYDEDSLPAADREYLAKALQRQSTDPAYPFVQPSNAVLQTTEKSFLLREMRNYSLFTELLQRGPQQKLERFIEGVVRDGDGVFVRNYLLSDPNDSSAIECFEKADRMLISRAIELESVRMDQTREVCQSCIEAPYFDSCGEETKHAVATFAGNDPLFFAVGDGEPCVMVEKLSTAGYIANALDFSQTTKETLELIFDRSLYLPSMENIKGMLRMVLGVNAETEDADIFDLLETLRVEESAASLIELVDDNIDSCLSEYLSLRDEDGDGIEWSPATVEWVLNSENLTSKTTERLIKRFSPSVKVQLTSFSSKDTMRLLLAANAVLGNAANVMHYYRSCDLSLDETLANWFAENDIPDGLTCRACKETLGSNNGLLYNLAYSDRIDENKLRDFLIKHYVIFSSFSWQDLEDAKIGAFIESGVLEMNKGNLEFIRESYPSVVSMFAISKGKDYCALIVPSRRGQDDDQSCPFDEAEARDFLRSSANISLKKKLLRGAPPAFLTDDAFPDVINAQILEDHFDISEIDGVDRFVNSSNERLRLVAIMRLVEWLEVHGPDSLMVKDCAIDAICESSREDRAFVLDVIRGQIERRSAVRRAIVSRWFEAAGLGEYVDLLSGRQVRIPNTPKDESLLAVLRQWGLCSTFRPLKDAPSLFTVRPKGTKKARGSHHGK